MSTGLTDMEELLARVQNAKIVDYLREALTCYGTGAYRACIVLTFIAVFEDLRQKTKALENVSSAAKTISAIIEKLADGQKPFEKQLVDQLASKELITELQAQRLKQIIDHRNKAAHPSGLHASAEEARFVYFEAIDKFLGQPVLSTTHAVDVIKERMQDKNYFPDTSAKTIGDIVKDEISAIHKSARPYLIKSLVDCLSSGSSDVKDNGARFIFGLAILDQDDINSLIYRELIKHKSSDLNFAAKITKIISANARLLILADSTTTARMNSLLISAVETTPIDTPVTTARHPIQLLRAMAEGMSDAEIVPSYSGLIDAIVNRYWDNAGVLRAARKSKIIVDKLIDIYVERAGSSEFGTANRFAAVLPDIDEPLAKNVSDERAFLLLASVNKAADIGAWKAQTVRNARFNSAPALREKAVCFVHEHAEDSGKLVANLSPYLTGSKFVEEYLTPLEQPKDVKKDTDGDDIPF